MRHLVCHLKRAYFHSQHLSPFFACSLTTDRSLSLLSVLCISYYRHGFGEQIMLAFIITLATFIALTAFTIVSKIDFSFLAPILCMGMILLLLWSLIMSLAFTLGGFSASWQMAFCIVGVALFVGFIIFDTYMIVTRLGVDDHTQWPSNCI